MSGIPNTTFNRSIKDRFTCRSSERLVRIIRVIERAVELFEGDKEAGAQMAERSEPWSELEITGRACFF